MDIRRPARPKRSWAIKLLLAAAVIFSLFLAAGAFNRLDAPLVERQKIWTGTVKRGTVVREIRGTGSLQPRDPLWITALSPGRVQKVLLRPGVTVQADTVLLTLTNPHLDQAYREASLALKSARSGFKATEARLERERLQQSTEVSLAQLAVQEAKLDLNAQERLFREGIVPELAATRARLKLTVTETKLKLEKTRTDRLAALIDAELAAAQTDIHRLEEVAALRAEERNALTIKAGVAGVLQELPWQSGRQVAAGDLLALVAKPDDLQAELSIPETQAREVVNGLPVRINTRGTIIPGRVTRIDPVARNGGVKVDVLLLEKLPPEARLDLTVDGTIELERLEKVLFLERPAFGAPFAEATMFRLGEREDIAERVAVTFGAASTRTIQVSEGLLENDKVILSDTSQWIDAPKLRLR